MNILARVLLARRFAPRHSAGMVEAATYKFRCPNCEAEYKVVRVEAPPTHDKQPTCLSCGAPLRSREAKFALKYFRVSDGAELGRGNRPKLL
jgi:predicted RNA-binding Zn-ribbon protein involved in translation (DUF1610 family)